MTVRSSHSWGKISAFLCAAAISFAALSISPADAAGKAWDGDIASLKYANFLGRDEEPDFGSAPLYDRPSKKGEILYKLDAVAYSDSWILVEPEPVVDKADKSAWYRVIFICDEYGNFLRQVHDIELYVNEEFLIFEEPSAYKKALILEFQRGRPVKTKAGQNLGAEYRFERDLFVLTSAITILKEPKDGAERISIPAGTRILGESHSFPEATDGMSMERHIDMDDIDWIGIVSDSKKGPILLGWVKGFKAFEKLPVKYVRLIPFNER